MSNASKTSKAIAVPKPGVLLKYEAACRAVAEAKNVVEVLPIRNKALMMKLRAKRAKDKQMRAYAMAIAWRAERRLGQIMREQAKAGSRAPPGRPPNKIEVVDPAFQATIPGRGRHRQEPGEARPARGGTER